MAIAKRPKDATTATLNDEERERQEQAFLSGSADTPALAKPEKPGRETMQTIHLRFTPEMLPRIDAAMREMGLTSRASWVRYAVMQTLKSQEK